MYFRFSSTCCAEIHLYFISMRTFMFGIFPMFNKINETSCSIIKLIVLFYYSDIESLLLHRCTHQRLPICGFTHQCLLINGYTYQASSYLVIYNRICSYQVILIKKFLHPWKYARTGFDECKQQEMKAISETYTCMSLEVLATSVSWMESLFGWQGVIVYANIDGLHKTLNH